LYLELQLSWICRCWLDWRQNVNGNVWSKQKEVTEGGEKRIKRRSMICAPHHITVLITKKI